MGHQVAFLTQQIQQQVTTQTALNAALEGIHALLERQSELHNASGSSPAPQFKVKASKPPYFTGNKREANDFLAHLQISFLADPRSFRDDREKVVFAASYLRERAFAWYKPHLLLDDEITRDWAAFKKSFTTSLGDPDLQRTLERELSVLRQTTSAAEYSTAFFQISSQLSFNDAALRFQFREGLKENVKDALSYADSDPQTVEELSALAIRLDNRLFERRQDTRRSPSNHPSGVASSHHQSAAPARRPAPSHGPASSSGPSSSGPAPMDIDATRSRWQPLTQEEKDRRRRLGLCGYCGGPGHIAEFCPRKTPSARANATTFTISAAPPSTTISGNGQAQEVPRSQH
ncbi:hypothetical protein CF326_g8058 [Tilletia indica]|nr:hypothetical protein CF326_g8058 [Tilletia indica]